MYLVLNGFICLFLSLGVICGLNKLSSLYKVEWVKEGTKGDGGVKHVIFFVLISVLLIVALPCINFYDYPNAVWCLLRDSGVLLAVAIAIMGISSRMIYNQIIKRMRRIKSDIYPLEDSDMKWLLVFSCLTVSIICFGAGALKMGFTIIAIIIGKFAWLDISPKQKYEEINSLMKVPLLYWVILFHILLATIYTCFLKDLALGCIAGVVISWIICFICYLFRKKNNCD